MTADREKDPLAWETLESTVGYACPGFDIRHEDVRLPDGTETDFDYLVDEESVVILPFTPTDDVVIIEEWRQAVRRVNCGFPAGGMEPQDDDSAAAAHRELLEETGYEAERVEHLVTVEPANGISNAIHHYFVARDCRPSAEQRLDFDESIRVGTTTFESLREAAGRGDLRDGRTALGVLYYDQFGSD